MKKALSNALTQYCANTSNVSRFDATFTEIKWFHRCSAFTSILTCLTSPLNVWMCVFWGYSVELSKKFLGRKRVYATRENMWWKHKRSLAIEAIHLWIHLMHCKCVYFTLRNINLSHLNAFRARNTLTHPLFRCRRKLCKLSVQHTHTQNDSTAGTNIFDV